MSEKEFFGLFSGEFRTFESAEEIRADIKKHYKHYRQYITRIEDFEEMDWVHIDCNYTNIDKLVVFGQ